MKRRDFIHPGRDVLLLLPFLLGFMLFYVIPLFSLPYWATIRSAFHPQFTGLSNFTSVWQNTYYQLAYRNTFLFTLIAVPVNVGLSFLIACCIWKSFMPGLWLGIFLFPLLLPSGAVAAVFRQLFANGMLFSYAPFSEDQYRIERLSLYVFYLWKYMGANLAVFCGALFAFPRELLDAVKVDGAGEARTLFGIVVPVMMPTIVFMTTYACANSFQIFQEAYLLYGAYPSDGVYQLQHYMNNHFQKLNYQYISAGGIMFVVPILLVLTAGIRFSRRWEIELP